MKQSNKNQRGGVFNSRADVVLSIDTSTMVVTQGKKCDNESIKTSSNAAEEIKLSTLVTSLPTEDCPHVKNRNKPRKQHITQTIYSLQTQLLTTLFRFVMKEGSDGQIYDWFDYQKTKTLHATEQIMCFTLNTVGQILEGSSLPTPSDTLHIHTYSDMSSEDTLLVRLQGQKPTSMTAYQIQTLDLVDHLRNNQKQESRLNPLTLYSYTVVENTHGHVTLTADDISSTWKTSLHFIQTHYHSYATPQYVKESLHKRE